MAEFTVLQVPFEVRSRKRKSGSTAIETDLIDRPSVHLKKQVCAVWTDWFGYQTNIFYDSPQRSDKLKQTSDDGVQQPLQSIDQFAPHADREIIEPTSTRFSGRAHANYGYRPRNTDHQVHNDRIQISQTRSKRIQS